MITDIEGCFAKGFDRCPRVATPESSTQRWTDGLRQIRRLCLDLQVVESVKWGHRGYLHAGRNIAVVGAFRQDPRLSPFNAALLNDPQGVLERQGPNTRHPDMNGFTEPAHVGALEPVLRAYLKEGAARPTPPTVADGRVPVGQAQRP